MIAPYSTGNLRIDRQIQELLRRIIPIASPPADRFSFDGQSIPNAQFTPVVLGGGSIGRMKRRDKGVDITVPGLYLVTSNLTFDVSAAGFRDMILVVNEEEVAVDAKAAIAGSVVSMSVSVLLPLKSGDLVWVKVYQDSGAALTLTKKWSQPLSLCKVANM